MQFAWRAYLCEEESRRWMSRTDAASFPGSVHPALFLRQAERASALIGMSFAPVPSAVSDPAQQFMQQLENQLPAKFQSIFGVSLPAQNRDSGYFAPIDNVHPGDSPQCVVDQVKMDFSNWNLPTTTDIATRMARTITGELSFQHGAAGFAQGTLQVTANESILWMVGYGAFTTNQNTLGAVYVFGAALQF
jgi:hypothetical protein